MKRKHSKEFSLSLHGCSFLAPRFTFGFKNKGVKWGSLCGVRVWRRSPTPECLSPQHLNLKHMRCAAGACIFHPKRSAAEPKAKSLVVLFCCCTNKQHFTLSVIYPGCTNHQSHKILYCWPPSGAAHPRARFHIYIYTTHKIYASAASLSLVRPIAAWQDTNAYHARRAHT